MLDGGILHLTAAQIVAACQTLLDKEIQGAVYGSDVERGGVLLDLGENVFGGHVPVVRPQYFNDHFALGRHPETA